MEKFIKKELEFKDENATKKRSGLQRLLILKKKGFNKTFINKRLNRILAARYRKGEDIPLELPLDTDKKIVLHGFYFITPEQQVFLKMFERAGVDIIFFQYFDNRFEKTFNFIRSFISSKYYWTNDWCIQRFADEISDRGSIGTSFLQVFETGKKPIKSSGKK